ncbi:NADH:ubiquinone oxidoreductase subunit NDUFA12 [Jannaschia pohangensis]|uniref:NADH:ubiquinone oxidoreductase subunit n=1 Tax=Jannaschia pohangensis TaxID=390807 RepID=A0A1I3JFW3_9RHOB|nr:NADH:ubiquinone oxidoreductase subunit NDUFA12 [Jannaschia pohangensis]SFI59157.1 NADH:ubiquinone oxidoreductase subunit [Jannaschia pohangensis]
MAGFLKRLVSWWDGQSFGTALWTRRFGTRVGEDADGNVYFNNADDTRRWVHYVGENDASNVPPDWFGWLHHTFALPPTKDPIVHKTWEKPHQPNLTGSAAAFARPGSLRRADPKPASDYEAWTPE